jgi:hypothetical protein
MTVRKLRKSSVTLVFNFPSDLSVFSEPANNMIYKIALFQFQVDLANKNTEIYPGSGP